MKKIITNFFAKVAMVAGLAIAFAGTAKADDVVYKTALFGSPYNAGNQVYTSSFDATNGTFGVTATNFNNNNNGWTNSSGLGQIKCGRKNYASVGTIVTKAAIDQAITKVAVSIDAITANKVNSIKLYTSSDGSTWTEAGSFTKEVGAKEVSLSSPKANLFYKLAFDCASGSSNGLVTISKVEYYYNNEASNTPSISANNVDIAYSDIAGIIAYTVNNGVEGGALSANLTNGDWLTLGDISESAVAFSCTANSENTQRTATVTLTYTYNTSETVTKDVTVTQAAAPVIYTTIQALFEAATKDETAVHVTFNNWIVSGVSTNGKNVFVTDNNGNGFVIYGSDLNNTYSVGNILSGTAVPCSLKLYNGFAELVNLDAADLTITTGGTVSPANVELANLSGVNTGALVSYENLTCSVSSGKYYLSDGTTTLQVWNSLFAFDALVEGKKYNITGVYQQYNNSTKEILPRSADDIEAVPDPFISLSSTNINASAAETDGTVSVTCEHMVGDVLLDVLFYESDGKTSATYDWLEAEINSSTSNVDYIIGANTGETRTAYFKVYGIDEDANEVYSELVTVTQAAPYINYATLPFAFDGGRADIENTAGLTQEGLDSDYGSSPKLKFNGSDDYVVLKINQKPGTLTFDIKGNSFSGGTFKVQTSTDGISYTDLETYTELGATQSEEFELASNVRFIKWVYIKKNSGNVALGNIALTKPVSDPDTIALAAAYADGHYWTSFFNGTAKYSLSDGAKAFTMNASHQLYLLGEGNVIPKGNAVIIMSDTANVTLTKLDNTGAAADGNILLGSDSPVVKDLITSGKPYVLGIADGVLGFFEFTGSGIPANKAYYVE